MLRRLMPLLLLVTAILFVFVMVSHYVQKVRLNIARTDPLRTVATVRFEVIRRKLLQD